MIRTLTRVALLAAALPVVLLADTKFTSTWAAPEARQMSLTGKKVATLVMWCVPVLVVLKVLANTLASPEDRAALPPTEEAPLPPGRYDMLSGTPQYR